jgi:hypothetical protein
MKLGRQVVSLKMNLMPQLLTRSFESSKLEDVQTSDVVAILSPVNVGQ